MPVRGLNSLISKLNNNWFTTDQGGGGAECDWFNEGKAVSLCTSLSLTLSMTLTPTLITLTLTR